MIMDAHLVHENTRSICKPKERVVRKDNFVAHGACMQARLQSKGRKRLVSMPGCDWGDAHVTAQQRCITRLIHDGCYKISNGIVVRWCLSHRQVILSLMQMSLSMCSDPKRVGKVLCRNQGSLLR